MNNEKQSRTLIIVNLAVVRLLDVVFRVIRSYRDLRWRDRSRAW